MEANEKIKLFIQKELLYEHTSEINDDVALFSSGLLNSLNLVMLISFIEETYKIKIDNHDITMVNFDSISNICCYLKTKKTN